MNKTYAISDTHGMYNLWRQVIESLDETDTLYILGDAADRGPDGWKIIKEALSDPRVIYVRGNHDQMLLECWRSDWCDNYIWLYNGGYETFNDVLMDVDYEICLAQLARTKLYHCYENKEGQKIHLSHAGFTLMENNEIPYANDLLWDREHIEDKCKWWPKTNPNDYVVHGHTPITSSRWKLINMEEGKYSKTSPTIIRYVHGHKICIDLGSVWTQKTVLLDLDTLLPIYFKGEE